jgi:predicted RNase H-like HicB family nuclease
MKSNQDIFTILVERDERGYLVATVPQLRGCHTQAKSQDVLMRRVREAILLCLQDVPRNRPCG